MKLFRSLPDAVAAVTCLLAIGSVAAVAALHALLVHGERLWWALAASAACVALLQLILWPQPWRKP